MRKNEGRSQQVRGQKRQQKVLNRKLNRNASDKAKSDGFYSDWLNEKIKQDVDKMVEDEKRINS